MFLLAGFLGLYALTSALDARKYLDANNPDPFDVIPNLVFAAGLGSGPCGR